MGFWKPRRETDLERELRTQRPQPPAELVERLCRESATAPRSPRSLLPRIALVGAVTVVLVASLGATGAVGYATKSVQALGSSVLHVVQAPQSATTHGSKLGTKGGGQSQGGDRDDHGHDPFHHEYDHRVPICHHGQVVFVPSREYFYRLLHGDTPAPCRRHR